MGTKALDLVIKKSGIMALSTLLNVVATNNSCADTIADTSIELSDQPTSGTDWPRASIPKTNAIAQTKKQSNPCSPTPSYVVLVVALVSLSQLRQLY
jgi:hypothetical protein